MVGVFKTLYMDFMGPLLWNGEEYTIVTMIDHSSKWAEAAAVPDRRASTIATTLVSEWITRFGAPTAMISDNTEEFMHDIINKVCTIIGLSKLEITVHQVEKSSPVERFHRSLGEIFHYMHSVVPGIANIHEAIALALMVYRALPHRATGCRWKWGCTAATVI